MAENLLNNNNELIENEIENEIENGNDKPSEVSFIERLALEAAKKTAATVLPVVPPQIAEPMIEQAAKTGLDMAKTLHHEATKENEELTPEEEEASAFKRPDDGSLDFAPSASTDKFGLGMPELQDPEIIERAKVKPVRDMTTEELQAELNPPEVPQTPGFAIHDPNALSETDVPPMDLYRKEAIQNELNLRSRQAKQNLGTNLADGSFLLRNSQEIAELAAAGPLHIPDQGMLLAGTITAIPSFAGVDFLDETAATLLDASMNLREDVKFLARTKEPENFIESAAEIGGAAVIPVPGITMASKPVLGTAAELLTPFAIGGAKQIPFNIGAQFIGNEVLAEATDRQRDGYTTIFEFMGDDYEFDWLVDEVVEQVVPPAHARGDEIPGLSDTMHTMDRGDGTKFNKHDLSVMGTLGVITAGLAGGPHALRFLSKPMRQYLGKYRKYEPIDPNNYYGPSDLYDPYAWYDYLDLYALNKEGNLLRVAQRETGADLGTLQDVFDHGTGTSSSARIKSAVDIGNMQIADVKFESEIPARTVIDLFKSQNKEMRFAIHQYIDMLHRRDLINWMVEEQKNPKGWRDKNFKIKDLDEFRLYNDITLDEIRSKINELEDAYGVLDNGKPGVIQFAEWHRQLNKAVVDAVDKGEYSSWGSKHKSRADAMPNWFNRQNDSATIAGRYNHINSAFRPDKILNEYHKAPDAPGPFDQLEQFISVALRDRVDNSMRGMFIDWIVNESARGGELVKKIDDPDTIPEGWKGKTVKVWRNGKQETYVTNQAWADLLKLRPNMSHLPMVAKVGRVFQTFTTGIGAPWFAHKRAMRDVDIAKANTPPGVFTLGLNDFFTWMVPNAWDAKAATFYRGIIKPIAGRFMERTMLWAEKALMSDPSGRTLAGIIGQPAVKVIGDIAVKSLLKSNYWMIRTHGALDLDQARKVVEVDEDQFNTHIENLYDKDMEKITETKKKIGVLAKEKLGPWADMYIAYLNVLQNAPVYAVGDKNVSKLRKKAKRNKTEISGEDVETIFGKIRDITGDPTKAGDTYIKDFGANTHRFIGDDPNRVDQGPGGIVKNIGAFAQFAREGIPWTNAILKGIERTAKSYWKFPTRWTARAWATAGLPQVISYFGAAMMGDEHLDYLLNQRPEHLKYNSIYWVNPWEPDPTKGFEIPMNLELGPLSYTYLKLIDYLYRPNGGESAHKVAQNVFMNYFSIPTPTIASVVGGAFGLKVNDNPIKAILGDNYMPKPDENSTIQQAVTDGAYFSGLMGDRMDAEQFAVNTELVLESTFGAASSLFIGMASAGLDETIYDENGFQPVDISDAVGAMGTQASYDIYNRLPLISNLKLSNFNEISDEVYRQDKQWMRIYSGFKRSPRGEQMDRLRGEGHARGEFGGQEEKVAYGYAIQAPLEFEGMIKPPSIDYSAVPAPPEDAVDLTGGNVRERMKSDLIVWEDPDTGRFLVVPTVTHTPIDVANGKNYDLRTKKGRKFMKDKDGYEYIRQYNYGTFENANAAEAYRKIIVAASKKAPVVARPIQESAQGRYLEEVDNVAIGPISNNKNWLVEEYGDVITKEFLWKSEYEALGKRITDLKKQNKILRSWNAGNLDEATDYISRMPEGSSKSILLNTLGDKRKLTLEDRQKLINSYTRHIMYLESLKIERRRQFERRIEADLKAKYGIDEKIDIVKDLEPAVKSRIPDPRGAMSIQTQQPAPIIQ